MIRPSLFCSLVLAAACGDQGLDTPDSCNPLGGAACVTPWPSAIYETDDASSETGRRLAIPEGALPTNYDASEVSPDLYNDQDGFSYAAPALIAFPTGVDGDNLVDNKHIGDSVTEASPTVVIDMATGELVHHFAELDAREPDKIASQALYIRPAKMLQPATRYAVAIKKTLKAKDGGELPISEGFAAILSGETTSHALLEKVRPRYADIFAALEAKGIAKTDLVVAWDFTTRSRTNVQSDLVNARTSALAAIGTNGSALGFAIEEDVAPEDKRIARRVDGTFDAPLFLTRNGGTGPGIELVRDGEGRPMATGLYRVPFTAIVPACALTANAPVPVIIYGHGLLGDGTQTASAGMRDAAAEICAIGIGTDMRGMAGVDVPNVALALNDLNVNHLVFDVLVQGMMNHIALVQIARGPMAASLFTKQGGGSLVDPARVYWYGISQGGIMGTTVCGIDPVIERCVVQVNAINYSLMLERSLDWPTYRTTLIGAYQDPLLVALGLNLMQQDWDRTEPVAVADVITGEGFPGTPPKQVLMQVAIADDEVPNVASEYAMRSMNIPLITPSPLTPFGVEQKASAPSGAVWYDYGLAGTIPLTNTPPPGNDVHGKVRDKRATIDMMKRFYADGVIENLCTAPNGCDCTVAGGCGAQL